MKIILNVLITINLPQNNYKTSTALNVKPNAQETVLKLFASVTNVIIKYIFTLITKLNTQQSKKNSNIVRPMQLQFFQAHSLR